VGQGGAQVRGLGVQPGQPPVLLGAAQERVGALGQAGEERGVRRPGSGRVVQPLQRERGDRLE
jgi:hypothetical protein